jgi:hypothetical protein
MRAIVDNDVLLKVACYGIVDAVLFAYVGGAVGCLAVARFVLTGRLDRIGLRGSPAAAKERLMACLGRCDQLEPTAIEQQFAADLELTAQRAGLRLDTGESQLCAMAIQRRIPMLLTGDKRAIAAIERLADGENRLRSLDGSIHCLEQLIASALEESGMEVIRRAICTEPGVDKALAICFACSADAAQLESVLEGLDSYIRELRAYARRVMS